MSGNDKIEVAPQASGIEDAESQKPTTVLKSRLDNLGYWQTTKIFWKVGK
jgi:hypothetical protein